MSDQKLEEISETLAVMLGVLQDIKAEIEANHELLINKLTVFEQIQDNSRDFLKEISKNIKQ